MRNMKMGNVMPDWPGDGVSGVVESSFPLLGRRKRERKKGDEIPEDIKASKSTTPVWVK